MSALVSLILSHTETAAAPKPPPTNAPPTAPQTTVADELKENLEAIENFKGSRDEKLVVLYCKQLGINYKNLSDEEFRWLIRILKKSKKMGTPISQRKKR